MTAEHTSPSLHHVVFAVAPNRHDIVARFFNDLGFALQPGELTEAGLRIALDWDRGIELISPIPGSTGAVAASVNEFLETNGDGIYTVVVRVPTASDAEAVAERHGAAVRFRQRLQGSGTHLEEIDLSVFGLPLTLLDTNLP
ncbi:MULTISPECIES: VOC family protein [unclassified Mycobacterium]|uniref:VOC family protein n=1 Tax=unclassified Mycobacterium TaxID=2642494 RepID=UPI0029C8D6E0|nr:MULTISPECIES: VOC family protein [unclassified Mycobacterium]